MSRISEAQPGSNLVAAIVLCGGTSRRAGVPDKTALSIGADTVLDHLLNSLPADWQVLCVGEERPTTRAVSWTREDPPLGGPVAGVATALEEVDAPVVVVAAGDQPFAGAVVEQLVRELTAAEAAVDAVCAHSGHPQPLLAAYRAKALRRVAPPGTRDVAVKRTLGTLRFAHVSVEARHALDVDTPSDLETARSMDVGADRADPGSSLGGMSG